MAVALFFIGFNWISCIKSFEITFRVSIQTYYHQKVEGKPNIYEKTKVNVVLHMPRGEIRDKPYTQILDHISRGFHSIASREKLGTIKVLDTYEKTTEHIQT